MEIHTFGIDLGKTVFHLVGVSAHTIRGFEPDCARPPLQM